MNNKGLKRKYKNIIFSKLNWNVIYKHMKIKILIFFLFVFSACDNGQNHEMNIQVDLSNLSGREFSDFYELETAIPLELTDSSVFDSEYVDEFIFVGNKIFVSVDDSKDIKVFDDQGKYLYAIDRSGNGPQEYGPEYRSVYRVDSLLLVRNYEGEMVYYDYNGNFIGRQEKPLDIWSTQVGCLPDGNFISNREMNGIAVHLQDPLLKDRPYYSVHIYSREGKLLKQMLEREKYITNVYLSTSGKGFYNDGEMVWVAPYYDNRIYNYIPADTMLAPAFQINVSGVNFDSDLLSARTQEGALKFLQRKGAFTMLAVTPQYITLEITGAGNTLFWGIIEKDKGKIQLFDKKKVYDKTNNLTVKRIVPSNLHGKLLVQLEYPQLTDQDGNLIDSPVVKAIAQKVVINENMNPVLCIYKEK